MFGAGDVRVLEVPDPVVEAPTDAIIRVVRGCICGSDLHPFHSKPVSEHGQHMGHEAIGVVEDVGASVATLTRGDFVVVPFGVGDGTCVFCREGLPTSCLHGTWLNGGQGEALRLQWADGTAVKVPGVTEDAEESLLASLLTLSDVYLTGWHAAVRGGAGPGKTVTVIGDGAVGLGAVLSAHEMGAERIILMGRHTARTDLGREFGATDVVAERAEEGIARVLELTGGEGSHVVLEAVGHAPAYEQAYGIVRPGGVISRVGVPQFDSPPAGFGRLFGKNATVTGGPAPVRTYLEAAIQRVLSGAINPGRVFDMTVGIDDVPSGYVAMDERRALKVMVKPR